MDVVIGVLWAVGLLVVFGGAILLIEHLLEKYISKEVAVIVVGVLIFLLFAAARGAA